MRKRVVSNGVAVRAFPGMTGVLIAFDLMDDADRKGLLGFAISRQKEGETEPRWLEGALWFKGVNRPAAYKDPGSLIPSNVAPIQKFRWSDYSVYPATRYAYTVHPVYGSPTKPDVRSGPTVVVDTLSPDRGEHRIRFNRAVAASQAFTRKFGEMVDKLHHDKGSKTKPELPPEALLWLGRGVPEAIVDFLKRALDKTWALDIAIYQYELPMIVEAVNAAVARGVQVRVVFHAKPKDKQTTTNEKNLKELLKTESAVGRVTSHICHHKFIVLSKMDANGKKRLPQAVLTGSTNFTKNGCYFQANVLHIVENPQSAGLYLALFETLFRGDNPAATIKYIDQTNPMAPPQPVFVGFSPRSGENDLATFVAAITGATRDVLFCTAFDLYEHIGQALLGQPHDPILRLGVQDKEGKGRSDITGFHRDRTANFSVAAALPKGIEGFLAEKRTALGQTGNILIHAKVIVVDFTTDRPLVISGSHNYSENASKGNDENYLMVSGDTEVADAYGIEVLRIFDHYRFRFSESKGKGHDEVGLETDDTWTVRYYPPGGVASLESRDRMYFAGTQ